MKWRITRWNCAGRCYVARAVVSEPNIFDYMFEIYGARCAGCDLSGKRNWWLFRTDGGSTFSVIQETKGKVIV